LFSGTPGKVSARQPKLACLWLRQTMSPELVMAKTHDLCNNALSIVTFDFVRWVSRSECPRPVAVHTAG
jgi:hypothetical protein